MRAFHAFAGSHNRSFTFQFLSGILPARPDRSDESDDRDQWVWGYGDPDDHEIKNIDLSLQHILDTLKDDGPFAGIVGFSSGAAMAAIVASILERKEQLSHFSLKASEGVKSPLHL